MDGPIHGMPDCDIESALFIRRFVFSYNLSAPSAVNLLLLSLAHLLRASCSGQS
jgi:hypothetical protein